MKDVEYWNKCGETWKQTWEDKETQDIIDKYVVHEGRILKTDVWNEGISTGAFNIDRYPHLKFVAVEISPVTCESARKKHPDLEIYCADVRDFLPTRKTKEFDQILDLSTIDHIDPEFYDSIIKEYARISRRLVIIYNIPNKIKDVAVDVWFFLTRRHRIRLGYTFELDKDWMDGIISKYFNIEERRNIWYGGKYLDPYIPQLKFIWNWLGLRLLYSNRLVSGVSKE